MRYILVISFVCFTSTLRSQDIFSRLTDDEAGQGVVEVVQDEQIKRLVGVSTVVDSTGESQYISSQGYRIQVFSGNKQRTSKDEAFDKEKKLVTEYPDQPTYVTFNSPFWKLRLGDFRTFEEADDMLRDMRRKFPTFAKEMFVVREEIKIKL